MTGSRKSFFEERTTGQIKGLARVNVDSIDDLVEAMDSITEGEYIQLMKPILPKRTTARAFNKYGPITLMRHFDTAREYMEAEIHPWKMLKASVDGMTEPTLGFADLPPSIGPDGKPLTMDLRILVVQWKEIFEAARVYAYCRQRAVPISIELEHTVDDEYLGKIVLGSIPSRRAKIDRYDVSFSHVPSVANTKGTPKKIRQLQFYIPHLMRPSNNTPKQRYAMLRSGMPGLSTNDVLPVMWADIALYYEIIRAEKNQIDALRQPGDKKIDPASAEFTIFPIITKYAVELYKKILNNMLNNHGEKPRDAEVNLAIGSAALHHKYNKLFFARNSVDGKLESYNWRLAK